MSDDASFDPRFAPEFQRGFPHTDGAQDASRTSPYAPGRSGGSSGLPSHPSTSLPSSTPATTPGLGERRRARGGAAARDLPGQRTEARSLIGMPPEEAERLSPYAAADRATSHLAPAPSPIASAGSGASASHTPPPTAEPATRPGSPRDDASAPTSSRRRVSPWRNPWLYVLFAAGLALTIAGVSLTRWSLFMMYSPLAGSQTSSDQPIDYTGVQVAWILGPTLVIVGGATLMGALFFVAASWLAARPLLADASDDAARDVDLATDGDFDSEDDVWNGATATFVPFDPSGPSATSRGR